MSDSHAPSIEPQEAWLGHRVAVTGAAGFIGLHLIEALARLGAEVLALDQRPVKRERFVQCDLGDGDQTVEVISRFSPEILFHLASHPDAAEDVRQARKSIRANIIGTVNTLEAMVRCGGKMFVYGGSTKVYGDGDVPYRSTTPLKPIGSYAVTKAAGWQFCETYRRLHRLKTVSVSPTMVYGPGQGLNLFTYVVERILSGKRDIPLLGGDQTRSPLYIDDAVAAYLKAARFGLSSPGMVVNISGDEELSVKELAQLTASMLGVGPVRILCREEDLRPTEIWRSVCDNEEALRLIGWKPRTDLRSGIQKTIEDLAQRHRASQEARATGSREDSAG